jgi:hypothetical protein
MGVVAASDMGRDGQEVVKEVKESRFRSRWESQEVMLDRERRSCQDGFMTQKNREALFDLLTLSIYADAHVSLTEERLVESAFIAEGWDSEYPKSLFIEESFARAREAADSDDAIFDYINEKAQVFTTKASQKEVLGVVKNILKGDGETPEENEFYSLLVQALPKPTK